MALDDDAYLPLLRSELDAFAETLDGDLSAAVPTCRSWTLADLAAHLGDVHAGRSWRQRRAAATTRHCQRRSGSGGA